MLNMAERSRLGVKKDNLFNFISDYFCKVKIVVHFKVDVLG